MIFPLRRAITIARTEAEKSGNSAVYIEKIYRESGTTSSSRLWVTRRGQHHPSGERGLFGAAPQPKVVEETPSRSSKTSFPKLRKEMGKAAIRIAEAAHYTNAGIGEFVVDDKEIINFEVNKRIQSRTSNHREVTGIDRCGCRPCPFLASN